MSSSCTPWVERMLLSLHEQPKRSKTLIDFRGIICIIFASSVGFNYSPRVFAAITKSFHFSRSRTISFHFRTSEFSRSFFTTTNYLFRCRPLRWSLSFRLPVRYTNPTAAFSLRYITTTCHSYYYILWLSLNPFTIAIFNCSWSSRSNPIRRLLSVLAHSLPAHDFFLIFYFKNSFVFSRDI